MSSHLHFPSLQGFSLPSHIHICCSLLLLKTLASNKINIYMLHPFLYLNKFQKRNISTAIKMNFYIQNFFVILSPNQAIEYQVQELPGFVISLSFSCGYVTNLK